MFETSEVREPRRSFSFWLTAAFVTLAILFVANLVRVNPRPPESLVSATPFVEQHFEGQIANERAVIEAGETLPFRVHFNYRATIKGTFYTESNQQRVLFLILDEMNYDAWTRGAGHATAVSTGKVPSGNVARMLEAGTYFLIFDNRGSDRRVVVTVDLRAE